MIALYTEWLWISSGCESHDAQHAAWVAQLERVRGLACPAATRPHAREYTREYTRASKQHAKGD